MSQSGLVSWSRTAGNNATADSTINWQEGQAPSSINDSARAMMASTAAYRDDISGATYTTGSGTAYALATYQVFQSNISSAMLAFTPHATNGFNPTLSVDGNTARPIYTDTVNPVQAGVLIAGTPYTVTYDGAHNLWILNGFYGNPYNIPLGGMLEYTGLTAPNASFVLPIGQAISRTTYANYFSLVGTAYGSGDGSTTFNVPDMTGRVSAMKEASATRLTSSYFGGNSTNLGATGGGEATTLVTGNLPPYTPAGTIANGAISPFVSGVPAIAGTTSQAISPSGATPVVGGTVGTLVISQATSAFAGSAQGGASAPLRTVPPTIIVNKILRII